ncbi:MAG: type II toxin-antitoxin system RelE/ParE family toxin [Planctomycetales bacterium]|nr:type II toxin-antitoxin system RelE/ParE family toxin [Planctomycetales bacterium]MBN8625992.1 type II toxin-antitoxin system RelE/ParE family toxin [Planctomycetota bacterium]
MPRFELSPLGDQDLVDIYAYIAQDSPTHAATMLVSFETLFGKLAGRPTLGERFEVRRSGEVRRTFLGSYVIYFRATSYGVEILRVLHGARDYEKLI